MALLGKYREKGWLRPPEDAIQGGIDRLSQGIGQLGHSTSEVQALLTRPRLVCIGRPTIVAEAMVPSTLLLVDVAGKEKEARSLVTTVATLATRFVPGLAYSETREEPALSLLTHDRKFGRLAWTIRDGVLFLGLGEDFLREALAVQRGANKAALVGDARPLALPESLRRTEAALPARPLASLWLDASKLERAVGWLVPYEVLHLGRILGLEGIQGWYQAVVPHQGGLVEVSRLLVPGSNDGLLQQLAGAPVSCGSAALAPPETLLYACANVRPGAIVRALPQVLERLPAAVAERVERGRERVEQRTSRILGIGLEELMRRFDGEWSVALTAPAPGSWVPELMLFVPAPDPDAALTWIRDRVAAKVEGLRFVTQKVGNQEVHVLSLPPQVRSRVPVTPALTFRDGMMVVSLNALALKNRVNAWSAGGPSYADTEAFQGLRRRAGEASLLAFVHLGTRVADLWDNKTLSGLLVQGLRAGTGDPDVGVEDLPTAAQVAALLQDAAFTARWSAEGLETRELDVPLSGGHMLVYGGAFLDWLLEETVKSELR
ncbi:MAG: hypothetical protein R3F30_15085 [Planctomycetota bacterium]